MEEQYKNEEIKRFCEFLSIPSISNEGPHNGSYQKCVDFIGSFCSEFNLSYEIETLVEGKPIIIVKYPGSNDSLKSILLNGHYDVVPCDIKKWVSDPFQPRIDKTGKIFARGTQDMKCVVMQYLEALAILKSKNFKPKRTIYVTVVPDEEIGGKEGVGKFLISKKFKNLNVGLVLDEGIANPENVFSMFYGERRPFWFSLDSTGPPGHGSKFIEQTAMEKILRVINKIYDFRAQQRDRIFRVNDHSHVSNHTEAGCKHALKCKLGDVISINLTAFQSGVPGSEETGGFALNVIPTHARAGFDMRVPPSVTTEEMEDIMNSWIGEEDGLSFEMHVQEKGIYITSINEQENKWVNEITHVLKKYVPVVEHEIFSGATDARYFRRMGIPAFGFSPLNKTEQLLHEHNEYIDTDIYLQGIQVYHDILKVVGVNQS